MYHHHQQEISEEEIEILPSLTLPIAKVWRQKLAKNFSKYLKNVSPHKANYQRYLIRILSKLATAQCQILQELYLGTTNIF